MNKLNFNILIKSNIVKRNIIFLVTFILIYSVLITSLVPKKYNLKEGDIAKVDIKATREVMDEVATEARIKQAVDSVQLKYNKNPEIKNQVLEEIKELLDGVTKLLDSTLTSKEKISKLKEEMQLNLSDEDFSLIVALSKSELAVLQEFCIETMTELYDNNNISDNSQDDIKKAQEFIFLKVNSSKLPKKVLKDLATSIGYAYIRPNFFFDRAKTEELRNEAKKKAPVMIKKDQIIVKEGEPVNASQIEILKSLGLLNTNNSFEWYIYTSLAVLVFLIIYMQWSYIEKNYKDIYADVSKMLMISILNCISLILARVLSINPFLIPLGCIPMLFTLLVNRRMALVINMFNCVLISCAVGFNVEITLLAIMNIIVGSTIIKKMQQRNDILYSSFYLAIVNVILTFSAGVLLSNNIIDVVKKASFSFAGSVISGIITIGFLPIFESTFDIVTTIKLLELSNPNNPLLKRLLIEAPGTYHHSVLVGNLAEVAAEEIGGNPVLARVASYYHDIGKVKRPYFFKENQIGYENPHNKITPNLSTLIITSHVKDGVEIAKEYNIPKAITDVIRQHHGTTLVKYFYLTVKNSSDNPDEVNEEDFKYPGPKPETKEAAVIMLADGVEAAVRSISEPSKEKIEKMVDNIIKSRLDEGQLDNCDLTLKDLDKIRNAFVKVLMGIYHQRIEYPKDKWENKSIKENKL